MKENNNKTTTTITTLTDRLRPDDGVPGQGGAVVGVVAGFQVVDDPGDDGLGGLLGRGFRLRRQVETAQDLSLELLHLVQLGVILKHGIMHHLNASPDT